METSIDLTSKPERKTPVLPEIFYELTERQGEENVIFGKDEKGVVAPCEIVVKGTPQIYNPTTVIINNGGAETENDSQPNGNERPRSGYRYWLRRAFVGKDESDEEREKENHPWLFIFKQELGRHLGEFIGTFFLVYFVAGIQLNQSRNLNDQINNINKGMTASMNLTGLIFCFGHVSGAHFNPCVTLGFLLRGAFQLWETVTYIIVQFAGAVTAAAVLEALFTNAYGLGTTTPRTSITDREAFGIEILITFILITVILTTAQNVQIIGATSGIAVGSTFGACELFAWNFTGASANPWRSIGPAIISGQGWNSYWVYIVGPLVGTLCAVVGQRILINGITRFETSAGKGHNKHSRRADKRS